MTSSTGEGEDWEEHNRLQRAKREAYADAMCEWQYTNAKVRTRLAAERYPLKKRVPHPDVVVDGVAIWVAGQAEHVILRRDGIGGLCVPRAALTAALEILDSPFSWVDDTSVEEGPA